jgi:hypothetical protein
MIHDVLIAIHALGGVVAFGTGCRLIWRPPASPKSTSLTLYLWSMVVLVAFVIVVVLYDWPRLGVTERVAFSALDVLALYMAWRAHQARQLSRHRAGDWWLRFTDHIGFTLIGLFDGFVIITAIDLGAPAWLVAVPAILGVVGGNLAVDAVKGRPRTASSS